MIFLASSSVVYGANLRARFLRAMGMVPKRKFTPDTRAIRTLRGWTDSGAAVGVFPEGERSWCGRPLPLVPGIGKLVRFLKAPVVTGRVHNGDQHWPRWAEVARWGRVHVEFDPPEDFGRSSPDAIQAHIQERIHLPPEQSQRWRLWGRSLAAGLSNLLFLCPSCHALESLAEDGDEITCRACGAQWRLDIAGNLIALRPPAADTSIVEQVEALTERVADGWVPGADAALMESGPGRLLDQSGDLPVEASSGTLVLTRDDLRMGDLHIPLRDVRSVSIEERRRLWVMTSDHIYEPELPQDSIIKWGWILKHQLAQVQQDAATRRG